MPSCNLPVNTVIHGNEVDGGQECEGRAVDLARHATSHERFVTEVVGQTPEISQPKGFHLHLTGEKKKHETYDIFLI